MLQGGRTRRRGGRRLAILALLLAPVAVAVAVYVSLDPERGRAANPVPASAGGGGAPAEDSGTLVRAEPVPNVPLTGVDAFRLRMRKQPRAALVFDVESGDVLWRLRADRHLPIASLTKIMTAIVVTERTAPDELVRITPETLHYREQGIGVLKKGQRVRLETLLNGLLILSANDAGIALGHHVAGSEKRFVKLMNRKAQQLGLECTHFVSTHGLESGNRSCARDLAVMTRVAMSRSRITRIAVRRQVSFRFPVKGGKVFFATHNPLFRKKYPGALGLKTGFTNVAGRCFVGVARRHGRTLGVVLLGSPNPPVHAPRLLDEGFKSL